MYLIPLACLALVWSGCARPVPDRLNAPRGKYVREVVDWRGVRCLAELPMTVAVDASVDISRVFEADVPWSEAIHFPVTTPAIGSERADVWVTRGVRPPDHPTWLASCYSECESGRMHHTITMYVAGSRAFEVYVLTHELGHALGLELGGEHGHSPDVRSIMYPEVAPFLQQRVTARDAAVLRDTWRRR